MKSATPKVLHKVRGVPVIQYVLNIAGSIGSQKTYVVLGHKSEAIQDYIGKDFEVIEQKKLLGTADAVRCVEDQLKSYKGDVVILCGDTPLLRKSTIKALIRKHKKTTAACTLLTAVLHDSTGYGRIIRDGSGNLVAIREDADAVGFERNIAEINVGVYVFKCQALLGALKAVKANEKKKEFYLTDVIELLVEAGNKIDSIETDDKTEGLGVNTRLDLAEAERILRKRVLTDLMLSGVTILDPETTYIDAEAKIGVDTTIYPFTVIESDVRIGTGCSVGPFARIRPGCRIGNDVEIGNYTEVSRTKIGNKTIMKHFSFLGDASVGASVNVGAGAVTANYDGENKNATRISDGAFIGSDAILVAPVKVGKKAVIGAGSVVPKGKTIPENSIAVGAPAKIISKGK
ncbi:MAG: bifunctional N-acetylglucosamine-1-phosphate uridyltransferase/glucosamine-1-phosphate acetyltransferase [Candidatus Omnitrophica bacterium]|nr:bifunctional N-acetylglucosamine-1-phosphate uridyltransferase/glucosamine-1-phosphate acetyltransferase [Candidatus Omnitrophota bacterium]